MQSLFQWFYGLFINCITFVANSVLDVMTTSLVFFEKYAPAVLDLYDVFTAVGWALLLGNLVFQAMKAMLAGLGFETESPASLLARTGIYGFLLLTSKPICLFGLSLGGQIIDLLNVPRSIKITSPDATLFTSLGDSSWIMVIIIGTVIGFQFIKLFFEIGERYVIVCILTLLAPLGFSMGGSKATKDIATGYIRMFASMIIMMILNVLFLKLTLDVMSTTPTSATVIPWCILIVALVRTARKADSIISRIGLNPAITGDPLTGRGGAMALTLLAARALTRSTAAKSRAVRAGGAGGGSARNVNSRTQANNSFNNQSSLNANNNQNNAAALGGGSNNTQNSNNQQKSSTAMSNKTNQGGNAMESKQSTAPKASTQINSNRFGDSNLSSKNSNPANMQSSAKTQSGVNNASSSNANSANSSNAANSPSSSPKTSVNSMSKQSSTVNGGKNPGSSAAMSKNPQTAVNNGKNTAGSANPGTKAQSTAQGGGKPQSGSNSQSAKHPQGGNSPQGANPPQGSSCPQGKNAKAQRIAEKLRANGNPPAASAAKNQQASVNNGKNPFPQAASPVRTSQPAVKEGKNDAKAVDVNESVPSAAVENNNNSEVNNNG